MSKTMDYVWNKYYIVRRISDDGLVKKLTHWDEPIIDGDFDTKQEAVEAITNRGHYASGAIILPVYRYELDWNQ
jgi:hypothetical protein